MSVDQRLVQEAQRGSREALNQLLDRYERKTYTLAYRLMGNEADASDAAQEALLRVFTRLSRFRGEAAFSTWLFRVVTNTCLDELRRRGRSLRMRPDSRVTDGTDLPYALETEAISPVESAERKEIQDAVHRALSRLPAEYRAVIVLRDLEDHSYQEVAVLLGTSVGTVKSRLHRARQALRSVISATEARRLGLTKAAV